MIICSFTNDKQSEFCIFCTDEGPFLRSFLDNAVYSTNGISNFSFCSNLIIRALLSFFSNVTSSHLKMVLVIGAIHLMTILPMNVVIVNRHISGGIYINTKCHSGRCVTYWESILLVGS